MENSFFELGFMTLILLPLLFVYIKAHSDSYNQIYLERRTNHTWSFAVYTGMFLGTVLLFVGTAFEVVLPFILSGWAWMVLVFDPIHNCFTHKPVWYYNENSGSYADRKGWLKKPWNRWIFWALTQGLAITIYSNYAEAQEFVNVDNYGITIGIAVISLIVIVFTHQFFFQKKMYRSGEHYND